MLRALRRAHGESLVQVATVLGRGKDHKALHLMERRVRVLCLGDLVALKDHWSLSDAETISLARWSAELCLKKRRASAGSNLATPGDTAAAEAAK